jgi:beta-glucosidase
MKEIELKAYRLSISWPRVMPTGRNPVNQAGLDFYDRLIDELVAANIEPMVTLFHWDFPYELYCQGGWLNPDSSQWFAEYTQVIVDRLSDRVRFWMTLNEPQCFIGLGHKAGNHAPGDKLGWREVLRAGHNALLAHGRAVQVIRERSKQPTQIGYAPVGVVGLPVSDSPADIEAAYNLMTHVDGDGFWNNTWWMDPIFFGEYPAQGLEAYGEYVPTVGPDDMKIISQPIDFFGTNIYFGHPAQATPEGGFKPGKKAVGRPLTAFRWDITPEALYWGPKFFAERYGKPIYITENGCSNVDWVGLDGQVHDPQRIDLTQRYLLQLKRAIDEGVDVRGYLHWSIMDNFEWADGYKERFGLIHVDYQTQKRTLKDSAHWYREVIRTNGEILLA